MRESRDMEENSMAWARYCTLNTLMYYEMLTFGVSANIASNNCMPVVLLSVLLWMIYIVHIYFIEHIDHYIYSSYYNVVIIMISSTVVVVVVVVVKNWTICYNTQCFIGIGQ